MKKNFQMTLINFYCIFRSRTRKRVQIARLQRFPSQPLDLAITRVAASAAPKGADFRFLKPVIIFVTSDLHVTFAQSLIFFYIATTLSFLRSFRNNSRQCNGLFIQRHGLYIYIYVLNIFSDGPSHFSNKSWLRHWSWCHYAGSRKFERSRRFGHPETHVGTNTTLHFRDLTVFRKNSAGFSAHATRPEIRRRVIVEDTASSLTEFCVKRVCFSRPYS